MGLYTPGYQARKDLDTDYRPRFIKQHFYAVAKTEKLKITVVAFFEKEENLK